jgi:hypothetical protein
MSIKSFFDISLLNLADSILSSYKDELLNDSFLLMDGGSNPSGGHNPQGSQPGGPGPEGPSIEAVDSPRVRKRKQMAGVLQDLLNEELDKRGQGVDSRFVNDKVTMVDIDISFRKKDLTLPSVKDGIEKDVIQYYKDYPNVFKKHPKASPGRTLVSDVIKHLNNNID